MSAHRPKRWTGTTARVGGRHGRGSQRGIDVVRVGIDVDEHRSRAAVHDDVGGRDPRERGHDHLVSRADARGRRAPGAERSCSSSSASACGRHDGARRHSSKRRTTGPCVSQPDSATVRGAPATPRRRSTAARWGRTAGPSGEPAPLDQFPQPVVELHAGLEPDLRRGALGRADAVLHEGQSRRLVVDADVGAGDLEQRARRAP